MAKIDWDKATEDPNFVALKTGTEKKLKIVNWTVEKRPEDARIAPNEYEFKADVLEEDDEVAPAGEEGPKQFTTTSRRLKKLLRPVLEGKDPTEPVTLKILKVGETFQTQYNVIEMDKPLEEEKVEE
jgi:hypothetical protein